MKEVWQSYSEDDFKQKKTTAKQPETTYTASAVSRPAKPGEISPEWQFKRKKRPVAFIILFATCVVALIGSIDYFLVFHRTNGMQLKIIAMAINKTCPRDLNGVVRWDNVKEVSDNTLQYNFTMLQSVQITDTTATKSLMRPALVQMMQTNENLKYFRENKIIQVFCFYEQSGQYLYQLVLTPEEYQNEGS